MIETYLQTAKNPTVFISGGVDSLLVLSMVREYKTDLPVYCFRQDFTKEQWAIVENLIKLWDLEVHTFPPMNSFVVPNGDGLARVDEYSLGGVSIPVIRDFVHTERCALDLDKTRLESFPFEHDVCFVGTRAEDSSTATGRPFKQPVTQMGDITFCAPLWRWTKEAVMLEADLRKLPYSREFYIDGDETMDSGNLVACCNCMKDEGKTFCFKEQKEIDAFKWDKEVSLSSFRNKFGFQSLER